MATAKSNAPEQGARDDLNDLANGLAVPPGVESPKPAKIAGKAEENDAPVLANPPDAPPAVVQAVARKGGLSGEMVRIVLAPGEGAAGKDAQFVRVNEMTWLIPRSTPVVVPIEAYEALNDTIPPVQEGADDFYSPRFSVSVRERIPVQVQ